MTYKASADKMMMKMSKMTNNYNIQWALLGARYTALGVFMCNM